MENQPEMPKSPEQILAEKKEKLTKAIDLMLNWQRSEKIKKAILPQLDNLTSEEIDYCLTQVRYLDDREQLRGPFADIASERLVKDEAELKEMEKKIGPDRIKELISLMKGE